MTHEQNFLECMRSRKPPHADVEIGRMSTTLCHLGNISQKLGRDVRFDPKTETFGSDAEANAMLTKRYHKRIRVAEDLARAFAANWAWLLCPFDGQIARRTKEAGFSSTDLYKPSSPAQWADHHLCGLPACAAG